METITFGDKNSYSDFGLLLKNGGREFGEAEPRTSYVEVPARDGVLDFTEAFGEVKYKARRHVFTFLYTKPESEWQATMSALNNYVNGQRLKIFTETDYFWVGRCFVGSYKSQNGIREVVVECDCEPYKTRIDETIIKVVVNNGSHTTSIVNDRKTVIPNIKVISGAVTLSWTDKKTGTTFTSAKNAGFDGKILDFKFYEGQNAFIVSGSGEVIFTYREASL